jgi:hypothetical protein
MAPNPAPALAATVVVYGVAKVALVQEFLKKQTATMRQNLEDAISALSYDPRPVDSGPMVGVPAGMPLLQWPVNTTTPKYTLVYHIDDAKEKVTLIAINPSIV